MIYTLGLKLFLYSLFILLITGMPVRNQLLAQPVLSGERRAAGLKLYPDFKKKNLYYYAPRDLKLKTYQDGRPDFQLVAMRYTGTACRADQGEARFTNGVQFSVKMDPVSVSDLEAARISLDLPEIVQFRPIPIRNLQSFLVTPTGKDEEARQGHTRIGQGGLESTGKTGNSGRNTFWTERTFTLKLDKYEAQLLWDQVATGMLAISFGYSFYADVIPGDGEVKMSGSKELLEHFRDLESIGEADTMLATRIIHANAFSFQVDLHKWPALLKKIDINQGVPPAYAAMEVRCYDFANQLRPDLAIKQIEIEATALNGRPVKIRSRFSRSQSDQHTHSIFFPFAVRMEESMQYRLTETTLEGTRTTSDWKTYNPCEGVIDITTPVDANVMGSYLLEVESDTSLLRAAGIKQVSFRVFYYISENIQQQQLALTANDELPLRGVQFMYNKTQPLIYQLEWTYQNGEVKTSESSALDDTYYFLEGPIE